MKKLPDDFNLQAIRVLPAEIPDITQQEQDITTVLHLVSWLMEFVSITKIKKIIFSVFGKSALPGTSILGSYIGFICVVHSP